MQSSPERKNISYAGVNLSILLINYYFLNVGKKSTKQQLLTQKLFGIKKWECFP